MDFNFIYATCIILALLLCDPCVNNGYSCDIIVDLSCICGILTARG